MTLSCFTEAWRGRRAYLRAAEHDIAMLGSDPDTPPDVLAAAKEALSCAVLSKPVPAHINDLLLQYSAQRTTQDRYGK